jgi:hypothetical protein
MKNTFKAGALYFAIVFGAGFILGPLRVFFLVPEVGTRIAALLEIPVMLAVIYFSARLITGRFNLPVRGGSRIIAGITALTLMLLAEFSVVLKIQGLTISDYLSERDPVSGTVYYVMLGVFAAMPFLLKNKPDDKTEDKIIKK